MLESVAPAISELRDGLNLAFDPPLVDPAAHLVDSLRLKLTNAHRECLQDLHLDARVRLEQRVKLAVANDEQTRRALGCHGRASGASVH